MAAAPNSTDPLVMVTHKHTNTEETLTKMNLLAIAELTKIKNGFTEKRGRPGNTRRGLTAFWLDK